MKIDAHQHFWALERGDYGWLTPDLPLYRDFGPDDLVPHLHKNAINGTILVQAAPTVAETEYMLGLCAAHPFVKGVVGWVDFEAPDVAQTLSRLAQNPALVGVRPMIQDIDDVNWMLGDHLTPAYQAVIAHDLVFDALTTPQHLPNLHRLLQRHPKMRVVIDHASKPDIAGGAFDGWAADMARLAADTPASVKLSGLVTEAGAGWTVADLKPFTDHLLDSFGPHRVIWGSDWPVCTLAASYEVWCAATGHLLGDLDPAQRRAVLGENAMRVYGILGEQHGQA